MKHILFILDYYAPHRWGAENVYQHIIKRLLKKGYKISILTTRFSKNLKTIEQDKTYPNLTIYRTWSTRKNFMIYAIIKGIKILKEIKKTTPIDYIHTATYGWAIPAWILAKLFNKKIILTVHEVFGKLWEVYKWYWWAIPYQYFEKLIFSLPFDVYHCVSRYTINSLRLLYGIPDKKTHMIYNGLDTEFRDPKKITKKELNTFKEKYHIYSSSNTDSKSDSNSKKIVGLYYGHAGKSKGLIYLIESIPTILGQNPNLQFIFNIISSQESEKYIKKIQTIQKKYKFKDRLLLFTGFPIKELRILVASSNFIVAPSLAEGFGSVHSEASSMGKILITTPIAAIPEVIYGKIKFIPPCNSLAISQAIKEIQEKKYDILPQKNFDRNTTVDQIEKIYM